MSSETRSRYLSANHDILSSISVDNGSVAVGIVGASALGQNPMSMGGINTASTISAAIDIVSMLGPDGSLKFVSSSHLPPKIGETDILSPESARKYVRDHLVMKLNQFAVEVGRELTCVHDCDGFVPTFSLSASETTAQRFAQPAQLYINFYIWPFVEAKPDAIRDRVLGYVPMWSSRNENSVGMELTTAITDKTRVVEGLGEIRVLDGAFGKTSTFTSPVELKLLQALTADGLWMYGSKFAGSNILAWRGDLYVVKPDNYKEFVGDKILLE